MKNPFADKEKRGQYKEVSEFVGYKRAQEELLLGVGKKAKRNRSAEKRARLEARRQREAEDLLEEEK